MFNGAIAFFLVNNPFEFKKDEIILNTYFSYYPSKNEEYNV